MSIRAERLSINPCLRNSIDCLRSVKTTARSTVSPQSRRPAILVDLQHLADNSGAGNFHEHNVIETDSVEAVQEGQASLNLVGLDHSLKDILDSELLTLASQVVRDSKDGSQVVRRMTP